LGVESRGAAIVGGSVIDFEPKQFRIRFRRLRTALAQGVNAVRNLSRDTQHLSCILAEVHNTIRHRGRR